MKRDFKISREELDAIEYHALRLLPKELSKKFTHQNGTNLDIAKSVLKRFHNSKNQSKELAKYFDGRLDQKFDKAPADLLEKLFRIWIFLRAKIEYKTDPDGYQFIKAPGSLVHSGFGDCKSFSIFAASILYWLQIPFVFRFFSKDSGGPFTHVYLMVIHDGKAIPLDAVYQYLFIEAPHATHKDFKITPMKIAISGIGSNIFDNPELTEAELELLIDRDRAIIKRDIAAQMRGIGNLQAQRYQDRIDIIDDLYANRNNPKRVDQIVNQVANGQYNVSARVQGIGASAAAQKRKEAKEKRQADRKAEKSPGNEKPGFRLKKVADVIKKGVKAAVKVATVVPRTILKGVLDLTLPKAAPAFIYLFINDPALINKLPEKARQKRKQAENLATFVVDGLGMKRDHFMGLLRNGILKQYGMQPETWIDKNVKGKIQGIGVIDDIIGAVISLIKKISEIAKKNGPKFSKEDLPDPASDFAGLPATERNAFGTAIKKQQGDGLDDPSEPQSSGGSGGSATTSGGARKSIC